jgi:anti-sigma factor RsiW
MKGTHESAHPDHRILERYLDEELPASERELVESHLHACTGCRRELRAYQVFLGELDRMPLPEPPAGFDVRILDAVLPRREDASLIHLATRAYGILAGILGAIVLGVLAVSGPEPIRWVATGAVVQGVSGVLGVFGALGAGTVNLLRAIDDLVPLADAVAAVFRSLETVATATLAPQVLLVTVLTLLLATLVLVWAMSSARERGVPHASLSA